MGADSEVKFPGNLPTPSNNFFSNPAEDLPRMFDALAIEVGAGGMAGPLPVDSVQNAKVNGFMAVAKPDGAKRQVSMLFF